MSEAEGSSDSKVSHLESLLSRAKPKSRYICQTHIQDELNSITRQIINGDIEVRQMKGNFDPPQEKSSYENMRRRRFVEQFQKEKEELQHRLEYVQNSLTHFDRYDFLRKRSVEGNLGASRRSEEWRREHEEGMKNIQQRKKGIAERFKEKEAETQQLKGKILEEEKARKKVELEESIKKVRERSEKRQEIFREQKQKLKELLTRRELHHKFQQKFKEREEGMLQERKKRLAQIRQLKQPVTRQEIMEHEQRVLQILKEREKLKNRQIRMNSSRARAYKPSYQSVFYKEIVNPHEEEPVESPRQKIQKMRQFSEQVKSKFTPEIDEAKRKQMEDLLEKEAKNKALKEEKLKQLLQRPKLKGLQYLQFVKKMPKKKDEPISSGPKTDRVAYKNYLGSVSAQTAKQKPWTTLLAKGDSKVQTAQFLQFESEKMEQKLRRKQEYGRIMKLKDDGSIDQDYYEMVKAKLDLLAKE